MFQKLSIMGKCYLNIVAYTVLVMVIGHQTDAAFACFPQTVKAKFHYASWFGAGSKLVRRQIPLRYLVRTSIEPASNQIA